MSDVQEIQREIRTIFKSTKKHHRTLKRLLEELSAVSGEKDWDRMNEDEIAPSLDYYLYVVLAALENEQLREVNKLLGEAAEATPESVVEEWEQEQERLLDILERHR